MLHPLGLKQSRILCGSVMRSPVVDTKSKLLCSKKNEVSLTVSFFSLSVQAEAVLTHEELPPALCMEAVGSVPEQ